MPDDSEALARVIEAVPQEWSWVDGRLGPPQALVENGQVARTAGYFIGRFHSIHPTIQGPWNHKERRSDRPDLCEILIEHKLPLFIAFDEAGFQERTMHLGAAKKIAAHHVRFGYRGWLFWYVGWDDDDKYRNEARCEMHFSRQENEAKNWLVELAVLPRFGGKPEALTPLLEACRALGLKEFSEN
ncbi:MAG: hypothetical protein QY323_01050 [Patescibacteria group bacterium]|nr:MAG: hypothetical protein QY323_01050 [Patescibacteria group bacterium]